MPTFVKVIISVAVIIIGITLLLFIASKLLGFASIWELIHHMGGELGLMWERITS